MATTGKGWTLGMTEGGRGLLRFNFGSGGSGIEVSVPMALDWSGGFFLGGDFFLIGLRADFMVARITVQTTEHFHFFVTQTCKGFENHIGLDLQNVQ